MCVIIHRPAKVDFDYDKLKIACLKNADGFGVAFSDRGKLEIIREYQKGSNDPERVAKIMEDAKEHELFVHLRMKSVGDLGPDNVHPFVFYEDEDRTYALMHNGTMNEYDRRDGRTDSYHFGQEILKPFIEHWYTEDGNVLGDKDFQRMIAKITPGSNKIAIFDNHGRSFIVNRKAGEEMEGCWISNSYSFQDYSKSTYTYTKGGASSIVPFAKTVSKDSGAKDSQEKKPATTHGHAALNTTAPVSTTTTSSGNVDKSVATFQGTVHPISSIKPIERKRFIDLAGLDDILELSDLSQFDLLMLVNEYPHETVNLILDLLNDLRYATEEPSDDDDDYDAEYSVVEGA